MGCEGEEGRVVHGVWWGRGEGGAWGVRVKRGGTQCVGCGGDCVG